MSVLSGRAWAWRLEPCRKGITHQRSRISGPRTVHENVNLSRKVLVTRNRTCGLSPGGWRMLAALETLGWPTLSVLVLERVGPSSPLTSPDCFFSSSARVHAQQTFSSIVVAPTAPRPISGTLHEFCSDGISVQIVELLRHFRAGVDIEILVAAGGGGCGVADWERGRVAEWKSSGHSGEWRASNRRRIGRADLKFGHYMEVRPDWPLEVPAGCAGTFAD